MYVHEIRKDTAEDADLYEELRDAWDGVGYAGLPSFDDVLPDILEWVRGIRVADTVFNDYTYQVSRLLYFDNALDESNIETAVRWLSDYGYVPRAFCGVGYAIELTDGYGGLSDQAVVQYAIDMIIKDGRYYPVLDESDYERREDAWLRDYFDGEVSGDMYFDVEKLPGYIETAKGGKRNA